MATVSAPPAHEMTASLQRQGTRELRWQRLTLAAGAAIVASIVLIAIVGPLITPFDPTTQNLLATLKPPSGTHPFGTDQFGRDVLSRTVSGLRVDIILGFVTTYVALIIGMALGLVAGYYRGWVDTVVMRGVDIMLALPFMVLVLAIVAVVGPGLSGVYLGLILLSWALYARLTRSEMLVLRDQQFMLAARSLGYSTPRILLRHALPNVLRPNFVFSTADIVINILVLASLSFLGVGVQPPNPEIGAIVADGQNYLLTSWWITTLPGVAIVIFGAGLSLIGDGLADRFGQRLELPS